MARPELTMASTVPLLGSNGRMPVLGFGVYQINRRDTTAACLHALSAGYRHIDTAQLYQNEEEVGAALLQSGLPREDVFVTTKIRYVRMGQGNKTYFRVRQSVDKIDAREEEGYVDLFLVHSPFVLKPKERKEAWLALEKLYADGKTKAIGVSNYLPEHLEEMKEYATVWPPAVNQILVSEILLFLNRFKRTFYLNHYLVASPLGTATRNSRLLQPTRHTSPSVQSLGPRS